MRFDISTTKECRCGATVKFGADDYYVFCPKCGEKHSKIHTIIGENIGNKYHSIDEYIRNYAKDKVINKEYYVVSEEILKNKLDKTWFNISKVKLIGMLGSDQFDEYYLECEYQSTAIAHDEKDGMAEIRRNMLRQTWDTENPISAKDIFVDEIEFDYKVKKIVRNDTGVIFGRIVPKVVYDAINEIIENATLKTVPDALNKIEKILKDFE